jgi:hypothetical protein
MLYIEGSIWVASMEFGIVRIDPRGGQIIGQTHEKQVQQLASDGSRVYAATFDSKYLLALSLGGDVIWKKDLSTKKTVGEYLGFPFNNFNVGFNRVFRGMPSRILLVNNNLILATGQGAIGLFTKNGDLIKEAGNSLGFGPKIGLIEDKSVVAVTRRGSLAKFSIDELNFTLANGQQAVGSFNGNGDLGKVVGNSLGFGPTLRFLGDEARRGSLALFLFDKLRKGGNQL